MNDIEDEINNESETVKKLFSNFSSSMSESQNYFLIGIQSSPNTKSYLLTNKGIEVLGEEVIPIPSFIDDVLEFAKVPSKQISVLRDLIDHLYKISEMIESNRDKE